MPALGHNLGQGRAIMRRHLGPIRAAALTVLLLAAVVSVASSHGALILAQDRGGAPAVQSAVELPAGDGRDVVLAACSGCHGLPTVTETRRTRTSWEDVVDEMVGLGAKLEDEATKKQAVSYLARWFGRANVNIASAKDLQNVGGFTSKEATALIQYRARHGDFHSFEDLQKVRGLDLAALDKNKARIAFTGQ
jgi:competence ComEA-like helix-hairpin-helix protein